MSQVAIYALTDPSGIRYVGKAEHPGRRFHQHLAERGSSPKCRWLDELRAGSVRPGLRILELVEAGAAVRSEIRWIRRLHRRGFRLVNVQGTGRPRRPAAPPRVRPTPGELLESARSFFGYATSD